MYIHAYQVDNMLNVYRKQLSEKIKTKGAGNPSQSPSNADRVNLSDKGQRQAIINQVSDDIIERITKNSRQNRMEETFQQSIEATMTDKEIITPRKDAEFTYTSIDENNHKKTNTLRISGVGPLTQNEAQQVQVFD